MAERLSEDAVADALERLDGWSGTTEAIARTVTCDDFVAAMGFVNQVALLAERAFHHPDISISWNTVQLSVSSHDAGGVTQDCIDLATKISERVPR